MTGTIVNGQVRLNAPSNLPEGTRVRLLPEADAWSERDELPPQSTESYEEHLAGLRESIAESKAGLHGIDAPVYEGFSHQTWPPAHAGRMSDGLHRDLST